MSGDDLKDQMSKGLKKASEEELSPELKQKIEEVKSEFIGIVDGLVQEYNYKIPFSAIHEKSGYSYEIISDVLLNLIFEKKITGFINDAGTAALSDDILIVKKGERYIDTMEPEYETG